MMVGALLHILEDALCGKVPFLLPSQKVGIRLFQVGSVLEYLFSIGIVLAAYLLGQCLH
jgi:inner membrane protein